MDRNLVEKINKTIFILREAKSRFKNPAMLYSGGKDSTALLYLTREAFFGKIPFPLIHIDTERHHPKIYEFRDYIVKKNNAKLIIAKNEEALRNGISPEDGRLKCCTALKTEALKKIIKKYKFDAIVVAIRRDEHGLRAMERYMSPRDKNFRWRIYQKESIKTGDSGYVSLQDVEMSGWMLFETDFGPEADHIRVHPILHWTELDVWNYIKERGIPVNPLYFSKNGERYRSLGCIPCTNPIKSNATTIDEIIEEIKNSKGGEREGRAQDKEDEYAMERLRALGYM